jgi:hypothetical protein
MEGVIQHTESNKDLLFIFQLAKKLGINARNFPKMKSKIMDFRSLFLKTRQVSALIQKSSRMNFVRAVKIDIVFKKDIKKLMINYPKERSIILSSISSKPMILLIHHTSFAHSAKTSFTDLGLGLPSNS